MQSKVNRIACFEKHWDWFSRFVAKFFKRKKHFTDALLDDIRSDEMNRSRLTMSNKNFKIQT